MDTLLSKLDLTITGYVREHGELYKTMIPKDIHSIILAFYQRTYRLLGIGYHDFDQWRVDQQSATENNEEDDTQYPTDQWYHLIELSKLCEHPNFISSVKGHVFIRNINNEIYGIGNNEFGSLGINVDDNAEINTLTRLAIPESLQTDNMVIETMDEGFNSYHSFILYRNTQTNKQSIYGFGYNGEQQLGYESAIQSKPAPIEIPALNQLFENKRIMKIAAGEILSYI